MTDCMLNGLPVVRGNLKKPPQGTWTSSLDVDADETFTGAVTLSLMGVEFAGFVVTDPPGDGLPLSGNAAGFQRLLIQGGAGGLTKPLEPREYAQGAVVVNLLRDILGAGGEALATDIDPALLGRALPQWSWTASTVRDALAALCEFLGVIWRVKTDGSVWVGRPQPVPVTAPDYILADIAPETGQAIWALNDATLEPDQEVDGLVLRQVVYSWEGDEMRALVTFAPGPVLSFFSLVGLWLRRVNLDYFRVLPGRVAKQNGDDTLQVQPDPTNYSSLKQVGLRLGLPDTKISGVTGRCLAGWEGAAPTAPVLLGWGPSSATKIKIGASAAGPPAGTQALVTAAMRTAQATMDTGLATAFANVAFELLQAGQNLQLAGTALSSPDLTAAGTNLIAAAPYLGLGAGGAAKLIGDFENAAASNSNFLTQILEGG